MNVVCGQCGTGYEFDDALVSERGTTVRCMHCGNQFRVHPERAKPGGPERWIVRKASGEEYIFRSLSELQRAIAQRRVVISDSLSRDGVRFRPMRELSELESFFQPAAPGAPSSGTPRQPAAPRTSTPSGSPPGALARPGSAPRQPGHDPMAITPTAAISVPVQTPRGGFTTAPTEALPTSQAPRSVPASGNPRQSGLTQPVGLSHQTPAVKVTQASMKSPTPIPRPVTSRTPAVSAPAPVVPAPVAAPAPAAPVAAEPAAGRPPGVVSAAISPPLEPKGFGAVVAPTLTSESVADRSTPAADAAAALPRRRRGGRAGQPVIEEHTLLAGGVEPTSSNMPSPLSGASEHRSGGPRWIIALVLLGGLALVAGTVGRDYFERFRETRAPAAQADTRVESFIAEGDELFRAGDWEEARTQYEKASALADADPAVLQRLLQVETTRADLDWLRLRILPQTSPEYATTAATLQERTAKLQRRVEQYQKVATAAPTVDGVIALVDALRVQGQVGAARTLVQQTSGLTNEANSAYVSAMLDVSDANPNWGSIISRLKIAVAGERGLARAQSALVYGLISAGQLDEARQQLEVLGGFKRPSPLLADLQTMLGAANAARASDVKSAPVQEPSAAASSTEAAPQPVEKGGGAAGDLRSGDPMADAAEARAAGELARAARLYSLALSKQPGNVAAMTGLGDVARSQGNSDIAMSHYGAALRANPNYGPAVLSCADLKWSTGDRAGAVELYRRLAGGAPPRVGERIAEFEKGASPKVAPEVNPESPSFQAPALQAPAPEPPAAAAPAPAPEPAPATGAPGPAAQPEQGAQ